MRSAALSIQRRLALAIALILALGGLGVTGAAYAYGWQAAQAAYDRLLAGAAFQIAQSVSIEGGRPVVDLPVSAFELLALAPEDRILYRVVGRDGQTLTGYDDVAVPPAARGAPLSFETVRHDGEDFRLAATRRHLAEEAYAGDVAVVVGHTLRARTALARDIAAKAMLLALAAGLVVIGLTVFAVRSSLRPLARIEAALAARDPKDLSPLDLETPREVAALVGAINRFMDRLSHRVSGIQTLIADTAHQLRTPIAALRAQAELAGEEEDPERLRAIAARLRSRAVGLGRLADQLLNQALVAHRAESVPEVELDLREVAMAVADEIDELLPGLALRLELPDVAVIVRGDAFSLGEAAKNLAINAFRHGGEPVTLAVERTGEGAEIAVLDAGPGIPAADWGDSGRRFARTAGRGGEGAGLGLAIVNAVAEGHRGRLVLSGRPGAFRAALRLPAEAGR